MKGMVPSNYASKQLDFRLGGQILSKIAKHGITAYQMESGDVLGTPSLRESLPNGLWRHSGDTPGPHLLENP
jgi:hypothetical protein